MAATYSIESNPFADPRQSGGGVGSIEGATLAVGRTASLTLGTDSLIVLGTSCIDDSFHGH